MISLTRHPLNSLLACPVLLLLNCVAADGQDDLVQRDDVRTELASHETLARALALALADPEIRAGVHAAFRRSPHEEGKVHFRTFLEASEGHTLRAAMADELGSEDILQTELRRTVELEFYLPFSEQRARWEGGGEIMVATLLDDDSIPIGFTLDGEREELDPLAVPDITAISLVPAESFDRAGKLAIKLPAPTAITYSQTGLWVDHVELADLAEAENPYKGYPEIEAVIFNTVTKKKVVCTSQESVKPFAWNMNSSPFKIPFLAAIPEQLTQGKAYAMAIFEDDGNLCVIDAAKDWVGPTLATAQKANKGKASAVMAQGPSWIAAWATDTTYEYTYRAVDPDDFIGAAVYGMNITKDPKAVTFMSASVSPIGTMIMSWATREVTL